MSETLLTQADQLCCRDTDEICAKRSRANDVDLDITSMDTNVISESIAVKSASHADVEDSVISGFLRQCEARSTFPAFLWWNSQPEIPYIQNQDPERDYNQQIQTFSFDDMNQSSSIIAHNMVRVFHQSKIEDSHMSLGNQECIQDQKIDQTVNAGDTSSIRVAVGISEGPLLLQIQLATLRIAWIYIPFDINDPRRIAILEDAQPDVVIVASTKDVDLISPFYVKGRIITGPELLLQDYTDLALPIPPPPSKTCISHIFYTSGSTGTPKGVLVTHLSLLRFCQGKIASSKITTSSRILLASSVTFDPNLGDAMTALYSGAVLCSAPKCIITGGKLGAAIQMFHATHLCTTPSVWALRGSGSESGNENGNLDHKDFEISRLFPSLQELALGGEIMPHELVVAARRSWHSNLRLVNIYGVTEAAVYQAAFDVTDSTIKYEPELRRLVGRAYPGTKIGLAVEGHVEWADPHIHEENPHQMTDDNDTLGEIIIYGDQVGLSYLNRPHETLARFNVHGANTFCTGDLGRWKWLQLDADGNKYFGPFIELVGRKDTQVKIRGVRIEIEEIEATIRLAAPLVSRAVVIFMKEKGMLVAFVEAPNNMLAPAIRKSPNESMEESHDTVQPLLRCIEVSLRALCAKRLPDIMVPARFVRVDSLPSTGTGKVDRLKLASWTIPTALPLAAKVLSEHDAEQTMSEIEMLIAHVWSTSLDLGNYGTEITVWDSFAQLGGDSLDALRVVSILSRLCPETEECHMQARTYGEITGALSPHFVIKAASLRAYAQHLEQAGVAQIMRRDVAKQDGEVKSKGPSLMPTTKVAPRKPEAEAFQQELEQDQNPTKRALYIAAADGLIDVVSLLVNPNKVGYSPDAYMNRNARGKTPLHVAVANGRVDIVKTLLEFGANCFATTVEDLSAAHMAAAHPGPNGAAMLRLLAKAMRERGAKSPSIVRDGRKQNLLHTAARGGNVESLEFVLSELRNDMDGSDQTAYLKVLSSLDRWRRTALHWAVLNHHTECVKLLLAAGADPDPKISLKNQTKSTHLPHESPLVLAQRRNCPTEIVELLEDSIHLKKTSGVKPVS